MVTNLCVCCYTSIQAKRISYFRLKTGVSPEKMRKTSLLVVLIYLLVRHHHVSASLYSFFCTRPVREGVAIFSTLTLT